MTRLEFELTQHSRRAVESNSNNKTRMARVSRLKLYRLLYWINTPQSKHQKTNSLTFVTKCEGEREREKDCLTSDPVYVVHYDENNVAPLFA